MSRALIRGGTGSLRTMAETLARAGWSVVVTGRDPGQVPGAWAPLDISFARADRDDRQATESLLGDGADLLVDGLCYTPDDAEHLAAWSRRCGASVFVSTNAVYVDSQGRHVNSPEPASFPGPIAEDTPTLAYAGERYDSPEGYGANKAEAERLLLAEGERVSVLRPSKIHGVGCRRPREWAVVQRVLDRRPTILLRGGATARESTTAASLIAEVVQHCAATPGARVLNVADGDPVPAHDLVRIIAGYLGAHPALKPVPPDAPGRVGSLPWFQDKELDLTALRACGIRPRTFAETVPAELDWLREIAVRDDDGGWRLPDGLDRVYFDQTIDYEAEDAYLALS